MPTKKTRGKSAPSKARKAPAKAKKLPAKPKKLAWERQASRKATSAGKQFVRAGNYAFRGAYRKEMEAANSRLTHYFLNNPDAKPKD